jgi:hypothetical protein
MPAFIFEPVLTDEDGVGVPAPLAHQCRACPQHDTGIGRPGALLELSGQHLQATPLHLARPAIGLLLQLMGKGSDQQIATEARRRSGVVQFAPSHSHILRRPIEQFGNLTFDLDNVWTARPAFPVAAATGNRRRAASALASRSVIDYRSHTLAGPLMR